MACGKYYRANKLLFRASRQVFGYDAFYGFVLDNEGGHFGLEMHFATTPDNGVTHVFYHTRQFVCAYMRMGVGENVGRRAVLAKHIQYLARVAALLAACEQLSVRVRSCPTLAETIVAFGVYLMCLRYQGNVFFAVADVFATLDYHRAQPKFYQAQCREQSPRPSTYDNDGLSAGYVLILCVLIFVVTRLFVDVCPYFQVYEHVALACVYATFQHPDMCYRP